MQEITVESTFKKGGAKSGNQIREPKVPRTPLQLINSRPSFNKGGVRGTFGSLISYTVHRTYMSIYPVKMQRKT